MRRSVLVLLVGAVCAVTCVLLARSERDAPRRKEAADQAPEVSAAPPWEDPIAPMWTLPFSPDAIDPEPEVAEADPEPEATKPPPAEAADDVPEPVARTVRVEVTSALGGAVAGAEVRLGDAVLHADEAGALYVETAEDALRLAVSAEGFCGVDDSFSLDRQPVRVTLAPEVRLGGRVLLASGGPAVGARVCVFHPSHVEVCEEQITGSDGRFECGPLPSAANLFIAASLEGYFVATAHRTPARDEGGIVLVLGKGGRVHGRVRDEKGHPVADADVVIDGSGAWLGRAEQSNVLWHVYRECQTVTDDHGWYSFRGLPAPMAYRVNAWDRRVLRGRSAAFVLERDAESSRVDIDYPRQARLVVRAVDESERPLPDADVWVKGEGTWEVGRGDAADWRVFPGRYSLTVDHEDKRAEVEVDLSAGEVRTVTIPVRSQGGPPPPHAWVTGRVRGGGKLWVATSAPTRECVVTAGRGGAFEVLVEANRSVDVYLSGITFLQGVQLRPNERLDLGTVERTPGFALRGVVRLPDRSRASNGSVWLREPWVLREATDGGDVGPDGSFVLEGCRAGRIKLRVRVDDSWMDAEVDARPHMPPLTITLQEPGVLVGRVLDRNGIPLAWCWGSVRCGDESMSVSTGRMGQLREPLPAGAWTVEFRGQKCEVRLERGRETEFEIRVAGP